MALAAFPFSAWAHGGEDHGSEATPIVAVATAARATAQTEEFELVAVLEAKKLTLTLDRFVTNEPVIDAQIEVDSGVLKAVATEVAPGVYSVPGETFVNPGKYPLTISVQAGESADLLTATLDLTQQAALVEHAKAWNDWVVRGVFGMLLLIVGGLITVRHRKKTALNK